MNGPRISPVNNGGYGYIGSGWWLRVVIVGGLWWLMVINGD